MGEQVRLYRVCASTFDVEEVTGVETKKQIRLDKPNSLGRVILDNAARIVSKCVSDRDAFYKKHPHIINDRRKGGGHNLVGVKMTEDKREVIMTEGNKEVAEYLRKYAIRMIEYAMAMDVDEDLCVVHVPIFRIGHNDNEDEIRLEVVSDLRRMADELERSVKEKDVQ